MKRTGQNGGNASLAKEGTEAALDRRLLLLALQSVRSGDFSVRLPHDWSGIDGKIADTFNEIVQGYQKIDHELKRVGQVVEKKGGPASGLGSITPRVPGGRWKGQSTR